MITNSSFITQSEHEHDHDEDHEERTQSVDEEMSLEEHFEIENEPIAPVQPQARPNLNVLPGSSKLVKQLVSKHEERVQSVFQSNFMDFQTLLKDSLQEVQLFYEEKLLQKENEIEELKRNYNNQLLDKEEEIHQIISERQFHNNKWEVYREKLVETKFKHAQYYSSPYSLKNIVYEWKVYVRREKETRKKEIVVNRLTNQTSQLKFFYLMANQFQQNKKTLEFNDLKFKYDTIATEMVMKYENEIQQVRHELEEAYHAISEEEKKRLLLEDELRKMLLKNMTALNVEALNIFQHINQSKNPEDILPANISRLSDHSFLTGGEMNNNHGNQDVFNSPSGQSTASLSPKMSTLNVTPSVLASPAPFQGRANNNDNNNQNQSNAQSSVRFEDTTMKWNQFMRIPTESQQQAQQQQQQQQPFSSSSFQRMNYDGNVERKTADLPESNQQYVNKLSDMYQKSLFSTVKFVKNVPPPPPTQSGTTTAGGHSSYSHQSGPGRVGSHQKLAAPSQSSSSAGAARSSSAPRYQSQSKPQPSASASTTTTNNSAQKPKASGGFGQTADRFKR